MEKQTFRLDKITDWYSRFGLYALNDATKLFENTSDTDGLIAEIFETGEDDIVSDQLDEFKSTGGIVAYLLYDSQHFLAGFVYEMDFFPTNTTPAR